MEKLVSPTEFVKLFPVPTDKSVIVSSMKILDNNQLLQNEIIIDSLHNNKEKSSDNSNKKKDKQSLQDKILHRVRDLLDDGELNDSIDE